MMKSAIYLLVLGCLLGNGLCVAQSSIPQSVAPYIEAHPDNGQPSKSTGTVAGGTLVNGKLMPWQGPNFKYFSEESYVNGRAFVNGKVKATLLETYSAMALAYPETAFGLMECSNEKGGKIWPHHTHQNGMSVDLMTPLLKEGEDYVGLDSLGAAHYSLEFDDQGRLSDDANVVINFDLVAAHILALEKQARKNGLKIAKVIFKLELLDELYATPNGKLLKASGIYFAKQLTPLINGLHDDHYHVDFGPVGG
jgi:penicillin-insensitive murein DD-endopeptidase